MRGPVEWLNKITIVVTKHILFNCQSGYGIFTFCGPIRPNSKAEQAAAPRSSPRRRTGMEGLSVANVRGTERNKCSEQRERDQRDQRLSFTSMGMYLSPLTAKPAED